MFEIEEAVKQGWLTGSTMVLATDNTVVEEAIYKGNSSSENLFDLVVRLRQAELQFSIKLLVTHVAGTIMIV